MDTYAIQPEDTDGCYLDEADALQWGVYDTTPDGRHGAACATPIRAFPSRALAERLLAELQHRAEFVEIGGSWGTLTVHARTGLVVAYDDEGNEPDETGDGYGDIAFFDPADIARIGDGGDILAFGYWTKAGAYAEPLTMRLMQDRRGRGHGMEFDDWTPLRLLPAPALAA